MSIKSRISYGISYFVGVSFYFLCRIVSRLGRVLNRRSIHRQSHLSINATASDLMAGAAGISVIIPERDNPALLRICLESISQSLARIQEPYQLIVVANGAPESRYQELKAAFPVVEWVHKTEPLGFSSAITLGLENVRYEWVFLLNNDMRLEADCLQQLVQFRSPDVFSIASQIFFEDQKRRREETGLTGIRIEYDDVHLFDCEPTSTAVVEHLYSGGGASLFRASLLKRFIKFSYGYDPFYWEDVDWGVRAAVAGYVNLFVPAARVWHLHRATVGRFYTPEQVERIFTRNKWIFYLRFGFKGVHPFWLGRRLRDSGCTGWHVIKGLLHATYFSGIVPQDIKRSQVKCSTDYRLKSVNPDLPWLLLVIPFAIYPTAHGAAIRQRNLYQVLSGYFNIWLISDEGSSYAGIDWPANNPFSAITLLNSPRSETGIGRSARMSTHARNELYRLTKQVVGKVNPAVVQIEHEELCELVSIRQKNSFWAITLHDVNLGLGPDAAHADQRLLKVLPAYDAVFTCSPDDSQLLPVPNYCIENGVDPRGFSYLSASSGKTLVFVGPFRYLPNREGIELFIEQLWKPLRERYPDIRLQIFAGLEDSTAFVTMNPSFQQQGIELVDMTDRMGEYLAGATLVVNPLNGIRGSCLKTIEALACGRICITTRDAARGLDAYQFSGLKIADDWDEFFNLIVFYVDNELARREHEIPDSKKLQQFYWSARAAKQLTVYHAMDKPL